VMVLRLTKVGDVAKDYCNMAKSIKGSLAIVAVLGGMVCSASAQAVAGFYTLQIFTGNNLIANQLTTGGADTLDSVLNNGVANGATFTELKFTRRSAPAGIHF